MSAPFTPIDAVADYIVGQVARRPAPHTDALQTIASIVTRPGVLDFDSALTRLIEVKAIALDALQQKERDQ